MYYYIVDPQKISQKEFERVQNVLYSSLSEYKISGEVVRITGLRSIAQLVENAFAHEVKTVVAVGDDDTLHEVINAIGKREMVVGYIPLGETEIGEVLGIKNVPQAIKTIANRRIQELDLGLVNDPPATQVGERAGYYFLSKITFGLPQKNFRNWLNLPEFEFRFTADDQYQADQKIIGGVINNSRKPNDGLLDVLLLPKLSNWDILWHRSELFADNFEKLDKSSTLHVAKLEIQQPSGLIMKVGERVVAKTPATICIRSGMLKMIVGKERIF